MLVYAGIDEAGYGPLLGPLCVAATVFVLEDADPGAGPPNLWRALARAVCRKGSDKRRRVAVDDSKKLKGANDGAAHPLRHLERGVLAFLGSVPATDTALLQALNVMLPDDATAPWYGCGAGLPVAHTADELAVAGAMVRRAMERERVACTRVRCEAIDAAAFNAQVAIMGNKSNVNFGAVMRLVDHVWSAYPEAHPRIVIDRQGGRAHYREPLQMMFPDAALTILGETDRVSRYRLARGGGMVTLSFEAESEALHLPVALASMTAKFVRELLMARLNAFFRRHLPEIRPTAGYVLDGRRYLQEIGPVVRELGIDERVLVRCV